MNMNELMKLFDKKIVNEEYNNLVHDSINQIMKQGYYIGEGENIFTLRTKDNSIYLMLQAEETKTSTRFEMKIIKSNEHIDIKQKITIYFYKNIIYVTREQIENDEQQTAIIEEYFDNQLKLYCYSSLNNRTTKYEQKQMCILNDGRAFTAEYSSEQEKEKYNLINVKSPYIFNDMENNEECRLDFISDIDKKNYKKLQRQLKKEIKLNRKRK